MSISFGNLLKLEACTITYSFTHLSREERDVRDTIFRRKVNFFLEIVTDSRKPLHQVIMRHPFPSQSKFWGGCKHKPMTPDNKLSVDFFLSGSESGEGSVRDTRTSLQLPNSPGEEPSLDHGIPTIPSPYLLRENVLQRLRGRWRELLQDVLKAASALDATPPALGEVWDGGHLPPSGPEPDGEGTMVEKTDLPSELSAQRYEGRRLHTGAPPGPAQWQECEAGPEDRGQSG